MGPRALELLHDGRTVRVPSGRPFVIGRAPRWISTWCIPAYPVWGVGAPVALTIVLVGATAWPLRRLDPARRPR